MLLTHDDLKDLKDRELVEALGYVKRHPKLYPKDTADRLKSLQKAAGRPLKLMDRDAVIRLLNAINTGVYDPLNDKGQG